MLLLLWGYLVYRLGTLWHSNDDYGFGWFVPLLCLCLFWERWKRRPERSPARPASGTFLLLGIFGLALLPAALFLEVIPNWRFAGWSFACAAIGITFIIIYFLGGRSWSLYLAFPVLFFLIAVPWPTRLERPLIDRMSRLNAAVSAASANALGSPAVRRGALIETSTGLVGVDEACSGIRSFQASVMVALFLGELFRYGFLRRVALLLGAVALAFSCNVVRTTYLVRTSDLHGLAAVNLRHDQAGFTILGITLAGLLVLAWLLRPRSKKCNAPLSSEQSQRDPRPGAKDQTPPKAPGAGAGQWVDAPLPHYADTPHPATARFISIALAGLVIWIVLLELGIQFWFRQGEKQAATRAAWSLKLPTQGAEFRETSINETTRATLRYDEGRLAEWRDDAGSPWRLYYFRWAAAEDRYRAAVACGQARGHAPDVCLRIAGMLIQTNLETQTVSINSVRLRVNIERFLDRGRTFHVCSCYWEPNEWVPQTESSTSSAVRAVLYALKTRDRGRNEKRVIKLGVWGKETDQAAQAAFREYLMAMIPK